MNKIVFISFADNKYYTSLQRLKKELQGFSVITEYHLFTEKDLEKEFLHDFRPWLYRRGYGYWKWKPYLIYRELKKLDKGDILIWSDAGNVLNSKAESRLKEYIDRVNTNDIGMLAFQDKFLERQYTKGDIFDYFHVLDNPHFTDTYQFWGGLSIIKKTEKTEMFVEDWWNTAKNHYYLITDKRSSIPNYSEFIENRHDQSIYSILVKQNKIDYINHNEFEKSNFINIPFLPIRRKEKTAFQNILCKLFLPWRLIIGLYLKYAKGFYFPKRMVF